MAIFSDLFPVYNPPLLTLQDPPNQITPTLITSTKSTKQFAPTLNTPSKPMIQIVG
jgi:hypothetical protein